MMDTNQATIIPLMMIVVIIILSIIILTTPSAQTIVKQYQAQQYKVSEGQLDTLCNLIEGWPTYDRSPDISLGSKLLMRKNIVSLICQHSIQSLIEYDKTHVTPMADKAVGLMHDQMNFYQIYPNYQYQATY